ncbi:MAG: excinuclease ABC subunit UvrC [Actinomycetia bacterium]|nr:excinuclease ABC subunit UvrC [Actinomycetes bacterium]
MAVTASLPPIEEQLRALPAEPGVYLFRGEDDGVLYVGKAKSLRARVRSYFRGGDTRVGLDRLVDRVVGIEGIVTQSEGEALHLEQNLIKRHRPAFNVRLRDDKSYPYIAVTVGDEYPRVMFTRERHRRGVAYFGPYSSAKKVRETLDVLNRVFPYRPCEGPSPGRHSGVPCLDYHIERCLAPCIGHVSKEEYRSVIDGVIEFLSGSTEPIQRELEQKMEAASQMQAFEEAARYRNRLLSVRHLAERQAADRRDTGSADVLGIAAKGGVAAVQVFPLRDGKLVDRHGYMLVNVGGQDLMTMLEAFCLEHYADLPSIPRLVIVPGELRDVEGLEEFLSECRGSRVEVRPAQRGEKRRLQLLAQKNAALALETDSLRSERRRAARIEALEELREALNLESLPIRIECYDISTTQGSAPVGSMVVFEDAVPKKAQYRKFRIRGVEGQDDTAMIAEVVSRRFVRLGSVVSEDYDESFVATPNLVVVDGGRGQLGAALDAMRSHELPRVAVVALAKREEEVFVPGSPHPIRLDRHSPGLQLLQRVRDEAHRFALGFHRQRRGARARESILDALPGVGPARKRALMQHFGSPERLLEASREELEGVPGVPARTGRQIHAALRRAGGASPRAGGLSVAAHPTEAGDDRGERASASARPPQMP